MAPPNAMSRKNKKRAMRTERKKGCGDGLERGGVRVPGSTCFGGELIVSRENGSDTPKKPGHSKQKATKKKEIGYEVQQTKLDRAKCRGTEREYSKLKGAKKRTKAGRRKTLNKTWKKIAWTINWTFSKEMQGPRVPAKRGGPEMGSPSLSKKPTEGEYRRVNKKKPQNQLSMTATHRRTMKSSTKRFVPKAVGGSERGAESCRNH